MILHNARIAAAATEYEMAIRRRRAAYEAWGREETAETKHAWGEAVADVCYARDELEMVVREEVAKAQAAIGEATTRQEEAKARGAYFATLADEREVLGR